MVVRCALPHEAEKLWEIRNSAIRHGYKTSYDEKTIMAWTQDEMPESFRKTISDNPFFVIDDAKGGKPSRRVFSISKIRVSKLSSPFLNLQAREWRRPFLKL
ncbi:hypothetical protein GCM10011328_20770 [Hafnia psychrotolerans]|uniref:Uncharacterized protein n=1 Tax=Hafnia psychrotolerans TaxID=1477018 RepID=A0ABQ1GK52_9GAMM|nr:hypothetical protein GCM10011328_20770 [Hafnia psychrotolerans]